MSFGIRCQFQSVALDHPITSSKSFLKPLQFAIHQVLKEGCPLHHLQKREEKQLSEESGFELGLNFPERLPIQESEVDL